jgi:hypothetical protein
MFCHSALGFGGGGDRFCRSSEGYEERISLSIHLAAVPLGEKDMALVRKDSRVLISQLAQ